MRSPTDNIAGIDTTPQPCCNRLQYSVLRIAVRVHEKQKGAAGPIRVMIRTNINQARRIRTQIIDRVEKGQSYSTDYYDIPAHYDAARDEYLVEVLLCDVGYFEYKARVESAQPGQNWVRWADGPNVGVSVTPVEYGRNNAIYCAFIRQYVTDMHKESMKDDPIEPIIGQLEKGGAFVLPPGGNFENFKKVLPFIINELGMRIIHLLPINPVPTSYGRMGMYGSPYATTDYFGIDHTYGTFSRYKTIEEQFIDLTSTIHHLGAKVLLDMVINHTGWASSINFTHRHWRKVGEDRKIISPGAWGVTWGDLVELDYRNKDLWRYMAEVFLAWCRRGIDGFRLDAGYMIPLPVWQYIISKVRQEYPSTLFLLEGLGGPWETTERLITEGMMNWAYSELFQNYSRQQIIDYLAYAQRISQGKGTLVHYAETHDNDRLAKRGKTYARMRVYLSALTSFAGAWGITNGVEWLATEKIDVHRNSGLRWGNSENLVEDIHRVNHILGENPAFWMGGRLEFADLGDADLLGVVRYDPAQTNVIVGIINLNVDHPKTFWWDWSKGRVGELLDSKAGCYDLVQDRFEPLPERNVAHGELSPGQCCLYRLNQTSAEATPVAGALYEQPAEKSSLIYRILRHRFRPDEIGRINPEHLLRQVTNYRLFIALIQTVGLEDLVGDDVAFQPKQSDRPLDLIDRYSAVWTLRQINKTFIISGDKWLVVETFVPCTAYLKTDQRTFVTDSIPTEDGARHQCFFEPIAENVEATLTFNWKLERGGAIQRQWQEKEYPILSVPSGQKMPRFDGCYPLCIEKHPLQKSFNKVLMTNAAGAISLFAAVPGAIDSKYDTLLAVPEQPDDPTRRTAMVKWITETVQVGQKYFDLDSSFLNRFTRYPIPTWEFVYDDGEYRLRLEKSILLSCDQPTVYVRYRLKQGNTHVRLISKCAVEHRDPHQPSAADEGRRQHYQNSCKTLTDVAGVRFTPGDKIHLQITASKCTYMAQPHWVEGIEFAQDAQRQLDRFGDAFIPGVFSFELHPEDTRSLQIDASGESSDPPAFNQALTARNKYNRQLCEQTPIDAARRDGVIRVLVHSLDQFIVQTPKGIRLIAGYPWLGMRVLDALWCVPGLLAAGRMDNAKEILLTCARTEKEGLLLDWICGGPEERTSLEASLMLFVAAKHAADLTGGDEYYNIDVGDGRSLRQVLVSIYEHFKKGIPAGVCVDDDSGLIYSPPGFSWMNTSYPRVTPRGGYCIEHQSLWKQVLEMMSDLYPPENRRVQQWLDRIEAHFSTLFWNDQRGYLADVLLAPGMLPARQATADMALRPNQLGPLAAGMISPERTRKALGIIGRKLLIPGGVRTLSEDPLIIPLRIRDQQGNLLVDPRMPYVGQCQGDETARRLAYHNGCAWPMMYPKYVEAHAAAWHFSRQSVNQAMALFSPLWQSLTEGAIGSLSEMKDGNYPHTTRGCCAYAPAVAETLRVYLSLKYRKPLQAHHEHTQSASNAVS